MSRSEVSSVDIICTKDRIFLLFSLLSLFLPAAKWPPLDTQRWKSLEDLMVQSPQTQSGRLHEREKNHSILQETLYFRVSLDPKWQDLMIRFRSALKMDGANKSESWVAQSESSDWPHRTEKKELKWFHPARGEIITSLMHSSLLLAEPNHVEQKSPPTGKVSRELPNLTVVLRNQPLSQKQVAKDPALKIK